MRYSFKQLEVFLSIAHHQNVSAAAAELSMSQSAASESLKTLESQFDIKLFDRIGKKLQLNESGNALRAEAEAVLDRAQHLERLFAKNKKVESLRIGATLSIGNYLAIEILSKFKQIHPESDISLKVANTTDIVDRVLNYDIDIGLIEGEVSAPDLVIEPWRNDELVVFASPNNPLSGFPSLSDQDLISAAWVLREAGSGTRQSFDFAMHGILSKLNISVELEHTEAIKRAVEADLGIGCLSRITLVDAFKRGSLIPISVPHRDFKRKFYFVRHKNKFVGPSIEAWIDACKAFTG